MERTGVKSDPAINPKSDEGTYVGITKLEDSFRVVVQVGLDQADRFKTLLSAYQVDEEIQDPMLGFCMSSRKSFDYKPDPTALSPLIETVLREMGIADTDDVEYLFLSND
ncbi:MAG: hypothetical protein P4L46_22410 [Fimbriimonas sp.]|nr:hypothetical protein [Fimbriimonas sp.]